MAQLADKAVAETREWRDALAHRERIDVSDSPAFGRRSLWEGLQSEVTVPRLDPSDPTVPTLAARRERLVEAAQALLHYVQALWRVERQFFASIGVAISSSTAGGRVRVQMRPDGASMAPPRLQRDPGAFISAPPHSEL